MTTGKSTLTKEIESPTEEQRMESQIFTITPDSPKFVYNNLEVRYNGRPIGPIKWLSFELLVYKPNMSTEDFLKDQYNEAIKRI